MPGDRDRFEKRLDGKFMDETYDFENHYWWFRGLRHFTVQTLERTVDFRRLKDKPGVSLDAGCGTGANMIMLRTYGRVFGFDLLEGCTRKCQERDLGNICVASVTKIPFKKQSFDLVTSFDVLTCLEETSAWEAIGNLYDVCRPGGLLILNLAAYSFLRSSHAVAGGEVHRYTRSELKLKLEQAGFEIVKLTYRNMFLFPAMVLLRLLKNLQRRQTSDFYALPASLNSFFYAFLRVESALSAWIDLPFGSSVFCIARKPLHKVSSTYDGS